ncbi:uncharacterized protein LOC114519129 [Dendronephthya gigantea]|uniref:uncharacterized protein LOC114519129 n=1 Tax=Dendronephthya gigantea TaxID=151771 RepID=UPI00106AA102|nr:uncharacterized protein LOC114519129 [Dendronephthya gigantea]XP_028395004.1 uncharacterized protein LOC114519129 [Dendronephthya gigantea]
MRVNARYIGIAAMVAVFLLVVREWHTRYKANSQFKIRAPSPQFVEPNTTCVSFDVALGNTLQSVARNILDVQNDFDATGLNSYLLGFQFNQVNDVLKLIGQNVISRPSPPAQKPVTNTKRQEVCPEKFAGKDLGYGKPYYRLGYARVKCDTFVPINELLTLLMYVPHEHPKPAMSYLSMMTTISNDYPQVQVILATEKELNKETIEKISSLKIKFKNEMIKGNKGSFWAKLLEQVSTPYVLIAPYLTHFDDDIDLYRLVRVLSYRDDVSVAGGSYRNLTGHWDLGCRQLSFNYWTAKYTAGYYRSFNECVVCDYLPGPFAAKTEWLRSLKIDASLSEGLFQDLFWRFKKQQNLAVVCADVMFNMDTQSVPNEALVGLANKHNIKKIITSDGTVKWFGCRRGLNYTNKIGCSWRNGIGVPPCDLWNLGDVVKFIMQACDDVKIGCEYTAGDIVGAVHFGSTYAWSNNAVIYFQTKDFETFDKLRPKFENAGFAFQSSKSGTMGFTISTKNWQINMYARESLEVGQMLQQNQLPTRVRISEAWVTVPRNPGRLARGQFLAQYFSSSEYHGKKSYYPPNAPARCPDPEHSACLDQYPIGGNVQFLDNVP